MRRRAFLEIGRRIKLSQGEVRRDRANMRDHFGRLFALEFVVMKKAAKDGGAASGAGLRASSIVANGQTEGIDLFLPIKFGPNGPNAREVVLFRPCDEQVKQAGMQARVI